MNSTSSHSAIEPDFSHLDTAEDILRDAKKWGLLGDLQALLSNDSVTNRYDQLKIACGVVYELAAAKNRDLAVDLLTYVIDIADCGPSSLRDYSRKHGCTCEWFHREADAMQKRLELRLRVRHAVPRE